MCVSTTQLLLDSMLTRVEVFQTTLDAGFPNTWPHPDPEIHTRLLDPRFTACVTLPYHFLSCLIIPREAAFGVLYITCWNEYTTVFVVGDRQRWVKLSAGLDCCIAEGKRSRFQLAVTTSVARQPYSGRVWFCVGRMIDTRADPDPTLTVTTSSESIILNISFCSILHVDSLLSAGQGEGTGAP